MTTQAEPSEMIFNTSRRSVDSVLRFRRLVSHGRLHERISEDRTFETGV